MTLLPLAVRVDALGDVPAALRFLKCWMGPAEPRPRLELDDDSVLALNQPALLQSLLHVSAVGVQVVLSASAPGQRRLSPVALAPTFQVGSPQEAP